MSDDYFFEFFVLAQSFALHLAITLLRCKEVTAFLEFNQSLDPIRRGKKGFCSAFTFGVSFDGGNHLEHDARSLILHGSLRHAHFETSMRLVIE
jgi:hypothetical protein